MLYSSVAIHYLGHVVIEERTAFGHYFHFQFAGRFNNHLALLAAGLVIAFHTKSAISLGAAQGAFGIFVGVDNSFEITIGAI